MIERFSKQIVYRRYPVPNLAGYNIDDCPEKNIIFTFNYDGASYWKIDIELLNQSKMIGYLNEFCYFCNGSTKLNESGYVYIILNEDERRHQHELILALIYSKKKFAFNQTLLQSVFDMLTEDEKWNFESELDTKTIYDSYDLGYVKFDEDVFDFIYMNFKFNEIFCSISETFQKVENWDECFKEVDSFRKALDKKWKKIELSILSKKEYYKNQGCEIMIASRAFDAIKKNKEYSLIAIEENEIYSIEYNRTEIYTFKEGQNIEEDYYTIRKKHKNKLFRRVVSSDWFYGVPFCQWALKKYHSGYEGKY